MIRKWKKYMNADNLPPPGALSNISPGGTKYLKNSVKTEPAGTTVAKVTVVTCNVILDSNLQSSKDPPAKSTLYVFAPSKHKTVVYSSLELELYFSPLLATQVFFFLRAEAV